MVFDIETAACAEVIPMLPPLSAPGNYKDEAKIAAYIREAESERILKLALEPDSGRIVAIGTDQGVMICPDEPSEMAALENFWAEWTSLKRLKVVGYNVIQFDIPYVITRSRILGVHVPEGLVVKKYGMDSVIDLMQELCFFGVTTMRSMDFWCKRLKLDVPADPISGKDIPGLVEQNHAEAWDAIKKHCALDIIKTTALAARLGYSVR